MIIQIRGTSGSGKSTVMKSVMDQIGFWQGEYRLGRKKPLYYRSTEFFQTVLVLGHYESPCGGCDTIGSAAEVFKLTTELRIQYPQSVILQEGLLLSEDVKWSSQMDNLVAFFLITDPLICIKQIESRRRSVGNEKPLNTKNTLNRVSVIDRARVRLTEMGKTCVRVSSNQATYAILNRLRPRA